MNIPPRPGRLLRAATLAVLLVSLPGLAADGAKTKIRGLITAVHGDTITLKDGGNAQARKVVVKLVVDKGVQAGKSK